MSSLTTLPALLGTALATTSRLAGGALGRVSRGLRRTGTTAVRAPALTATQARLLREVAHAPALSLAALAERAPADRAAVNAAVCALRERGLVAVERARCDRRRLVVRATDAGRGLIGTGRGRGATRG